MAIWLISDCRQNWLAIDASLVKKGGDNLNLKLDGREYQLTKSGERKFTFGSANENELVFVAGKNGKIDFVFSGLYAAKRV